MRDRLVRQVGHAGDRIGVGVDREVRLRPAVVHPVLVAARPLRHDGDERRPPFLRPDPRLHQPGEPAVVVGRDRPGAEVVHRVVGQQRDRPVVERLDRQDGQLGIDRPRRPDRVRVLVAGVHVGADRPQAERVGEHLVGPIDPAPAVGVLEVVDRCPSDPGRGQVPRGLLDRLGDPAGQVLDVFGVRATAEGRDRRGGRVRVRGRDQHPLGRDSRRLAGPLLRHVHQLARQSAAIHHDDRQACHAVVEHQATRRERVVDRVGASPPGTPR